MGKTCNTTLVQDYIRDRIARENLKPGDMLPPEGEIANELGISRNSVREATRALESIGVLEIRHGVGLVLRSFNMDAIVDILTYGFLLDNATILDLYDIRKLLECSMMSRVIEKVDNVAVSKCELILAEWEYLVQDEKPVHDIDRKFHDTLYEPVGNNLLISLCNIFWVSFKSAETKGYIKHFTPSCKEEALKILEDHRQILEAIKTKDLTLATQRMGDHFKQIEKPEFPMAN